MNRRLGLVVALTLCASATAASAGPNADKLGTCLVKSTTGGDRTDFMLWVFTSMALHPDVSRYANIPDGDRKAISRKAGTVMERLITVDCRAETIAAVRAEGDSAPLQTAFSRLGEVAMAELSTDPKVAAGLASLAEGLDADKLQAVMKEARSGSKP